MANQKILIIGHGFIGTILESYLATQSDKYHCLVADYPDIDLTDLARTQGVIAELNPNFIVNTVGFTNTNLAEKPTEQAKAFHLNVQAPANLLVACSELKIPWVHLSSGMIFDASNHKLGWDENDSPHPINWYAWTKALADSMLSSYLDSEKIIILRIHLPVSSFSHPRNFINRLLSFEKVVDVPSSISVMDEIFPCLLSLLEQGKSGIYNAVNPGIISALEMVKMMQQIQLIPSGKTIQGISRAELDQMIDVSGGAKQTFPVLDSRKIQRHSLPLSQVDIALMETLKRFKANQVV